MVIVICVLSSLCYNLYVEERKVVIMLAPSEGELFVGHELKLYFSYEFVYNLGFCLLMCLEMDAFEFILVGTC